MFSVFIVVLVVLSIKNDRRFVVGMDNHNDDKVEDTSINKYAHDKRSYRNVKLSNEMEVLLISDPTAERSAASLVVGVGPLSANEEIPGLMNVVGRALMYEFQHFVLQINGHSNVATHDDEQIFTFDVPAEYLSVAVNSFARSFVEPTFTNMTESILDTLTQMVDFEFGGCSVEDRWAIRQVEKYLSDEKHRYYHSFMGNALTLYWSVAPEIDTQEPVVLPWGRYTDPRKTILRNKMWEFYSAWFSANIMTLAVLGNESLNVLEEMVTIRCPFDELPNKNLTRITYPYEQHPWGREQLRRKLYILPISKELQILRLRFPTPDITDQYRTAPEQYVTELIMSRVPGSLAVKLQEKGMCRNLGAEYEAVAGIGFFGIECDLDDTSVQLVDEIIHLIFQFLYMVKADGVQEWLFKQFWNVNEMHFQLRTISGYSESLVQYFASLMQKYPVKDVVSLPSLNDQWDPDLIRQFLCYLTPDNVNITIVSAQLVKIVNLDDYWFGTQYAIEKIPPETIEKWKTILSNHGLQLPKRNEFVPENFISYPNDESGSQYPRIIHKSSLSEIWFKVDDSFQSPLLNVHLHLFIPELVFDPAKIFLLDVFIALTDLALSECRLLASIAGLHYRMEKGINGILVHLHGLNDKLPLLLKIILSKLTANFVNDIGRQHFENMKKQVNLYVQDLAKVFEDPFVLAIDQIRIILTGFTYSVDEVLRSASTTTYDDVEKLAQKMTNWSSVFVQGFIHGNYNLLKALEITSLVENSFQSARGLLMQQKIPIRAVQLDAGHFHYNLFKANQAVNSYVVYFQFQYHSARNEVIGLLLWQMLQQLSEELLPSKVGGLRLTIVDYLDECALSVTQMFFQDRFTVETRSTVFRLHNARGFLISVKSNQAANFVDSEIEGFLRNAPEKLESMPDDLLETHKRSLSEKVKVTVQSFDGLNDLYWCEISKQLYIFDRVTNVIQELESVRKEDILALFREVLDKSSGKRRKLSVSILDKKSRPDIPNGATEITDLTDFKNASHMFEIYSNQF